MPNKLFLFHVHSDYSNCTTNIDSVTKVQHYVKAAKDAGMTGLAFSEHGNIFNWATKKQLIEAEGMKYVHAIEFYLTQSLTEKVRDNYHLIAMAKNWEGVKEINQLVTTSRNRDDGHFYYVPRITLDELLNTSDNLIFTSACLGGPLHNGTDNVKQTILDYFSMNSDRCFLEIQHHAVREQALYNLELVNLGKQYNIRLIAGTDTHSLNELRARARSVVQASRNIKFDNEDGWDLTFKDYDGLVKAYEEQGILDEDVYKEAIANTCVVEDMVESFEIDTTPKFPKLYDNPQEVLKDKVYKAVDTHPYALKNHSKEEILNRVDKELDVFHKTNMEGFLLFQTYIREWEHKNDIWVGPGRGSVSGSMVAYLLGITEMDSIKFGLNFFRFANPDRQSNPDVDSDYFSPDRDRARNFLLTDKNIVSSEIVSFGTIAFRGAIEYVCKGLGYDLTVTKNLKNSIKVDENKKEYVDESLKNKYPDVFEYVDIVNGTIVSVGTHPAGVLCATRDIGSEIGLVTLSTTPYPVSCLDMHGLDAGWWTKMDMLGLDNVGLINETCKLAGIDRINPDNINLDDWEVWKSIREDNTCIFQYESALAKRVLESLFSDEMITKIRERYGNVPYLKLFSFGNALIRPCGASVREKVANGEFCETGIKDIDDMLAPALGYCIIQEDIMKFAMKFCGYSLNEADALRKCIAAGTRITMGDGSVRAIEDVIVGDRVMSFDNGVFRGKNVVNVFDNGEKPVYNLLLSNGFSIKATLDHKFLTQDGWKEISQISSNDCVFVPERIVCDSDKRRPNQRLSNEAMFLIGMMIGDGTIGGEWYTISFTNSDIALIEKFKECVKSLRRIETNSSFVVSKTEGKTVDTVYRIVPPSGPLRLITANLFKRLGINVKSKDKHIPHQLMNYPIGSKLLNLLGGLYSTDGGYCSQGLRIDYYSISKALVMDIQTILLKLGIFSYIQIKPVNGYNYNSYTLSISGPKYLEIFKNTILKYMVGRKVNEFSDIIERKICLEGAYNYRLPSICREEIIAASVKYDRPLNSIFGGRYKLSKNVESITDINAAKLVEKISCPLTYKYLSEDFIALEVESVKFVGVEHVYDIEVDGSHNFLANGIVAHNCIAKKKGTADALDDICMRFKQVSQPKYNLTDQQCCDIIEPVVQCISDASRYAFSWNHSDAYSFIGYACGWLKHYYPLEFVTTCFNVWNDKEEDTKVVFELAKRLGIKVSPPKFRYSLSDYFMDKETNTVYKGIKSIKYINSNVGEYLYLLRNEKYDTFFDFLRLIDTKMVDARQLTILIKLDFFSEFGNSRFLMALYEFYQEFGNAKHVSKSKLKSDVVMSIFKRNGRETEKKIVDLDINNVLREIEQMFKVTYSTDFSMKEKIAWQKEYVGYIDFRTGKEEDRTRLLVEEVSTLKRKADGMVWAYVLKTLSIGSGKKSELVVVENIYKKNPILQFDVIRISPNCLSKNVYNGRTSWRLKNYKTER